MPFTLFSGYFRLVEALWLVQNSFRFTNYRFKLILKWLTLDVEVDRLAVCLSHFVISDAGDVTSHWTSHVLKHQTLIGHYDVGWCVVHQFYTLHRKWSQFCIDQFLIFSRHHWAIVNRTNARPKSNKSTEGPVTTILPKICIRSSLEWIKSIYFKPKAVEYFKSWIQSKSNRNGLLVITA